MPFEVQQGTLLSLQTPLQVSKVSLMSSVTPESRLQMSRDPSVSAGASNRDVGDHRKRHSLASTSMININLTEVPKIQ